MVKKKIFEVDSLIGNAKKWKEDEVLISKKKTIILKVFKKDKRVYFTWDKDIKWDEILNIFGSIPLPPYIKRDIEDSDYRSYQTVYSKVNEASTDKPSSSNLIPPPPAFGWITTSFVS